MGLRGLQEMVQSRGEEVAHTQGSCLEAVGKYLKETISNLDCSNRAEGKRAHKPT